MLGDAEGPAHTTWSERTPRFKGTYWLGPEWLKFVKHAPWKLLQLIEGSDDEVDRQIAADIFYIEEPAQEMGRAPRPASGGEPIASGPFEGTPQQFHVYEVAGGFVISLSDVEDCPDVIRIRTAYDLVKGDPFKRWSRLDFDFDGASGGPSVAVENGAILRAEGNELEVAVEAPELFRLEVRGLGTTRDVIVEVQGVQAAAPGWQS
jgi:hypothetical protein